LVADSLLIADTDTFGRCSQYRAGAAGTTGTVLAVPLFCHLMISRCGLYSRGGVAPTWWRSIDMNVVYACSSKWSAAHVSLSWNFLLLLTSCLPDSFYVTDDTESRSQSVQSTTALREPIQTTEKWRWTFFSMLCASTHCLWQWPYHSKIACAGAAITDQAQDRQWDQVHRDFADNGTRHTRPRAQFMDVSLRHVPHTGILLHPPPLTPLWN